MGQALWQEPCSLLSGSLLKALLEACRTLIHFIMGIDKIPGSALGPLLACGQCSRDPVEYLRG